MPRLRKQEQWRSKKFAIGYIYNRDGIAYINIAGRVRRSTKLKFIPANKKLAIDILENAVVEYLAPSQHMQEEQHTIYSFLAIYLKLYMKSRTATARRNFQYAFQGLISKEFSMSDVRAIQQHISDNINASEYSGAT